MQATLVAYYGKKPPELLELIQNLQDRLTLLLSTSSFHPYPIEQVHGTIIGMEGFIRDGKVLNKNFHDLRGGALRPMDIDGALTFLRLTTLLPLHIRAGGFKKSEAYPFTSRGAHPYYRSFSIQREIVVIIAWPATQNGTYSTALHQLRYHLGLYNILHRYLLTDSDVDNDLYLVLGRVSSNILDATALTHEVEDCLRSHLADIHPFIIPLSHDNISVVCYSSNMLPRQTSLVFPISDTCLDGQLLLKTYIAKVNN